MSQPNRIFLVALLVALAFGAARADGIINPGGSSAGSGVTSIQTNGGVTQNGTTGAVQLYSAPSYQNVLRNSGLTGIVTGQYYAQTGSTSGQSFTITTSGNFCPDGVFWIPTGGNITCHFDQGQDAYIVPSAGVTDLKMRLVIDGAVAAKVGGILSTFQMPIQQGGSGLSTLTPTLTAYYAGVLNNWGSPNADLGSTTLSAIDSAGDSTTVNYLFTPNNQAFTGYELVLDFGAYNNTSARIEITPGFDFRATPGAKCGSTSPPCIATAAQLPKPEIPPPPLEATWNEEFDDIWGYGVLGTGEIDATTLVRWGINFRVPMLCVTPTVLETNNTFVNIHFAGTSTPSTGFATEAVTNRNLDIGATAVGLTLGDSALLTDDTAGAYIYASCALAGG